MNVRLDPFTFLPEELSLLVLGHLDPRDLSRCACLSREWKRLAGDNDLWQALWQRHFDHEPLNPTVSIKQQFLARIKDHADNLSQIIERVRCFASGVTPLQKSSLKFVFLDPAHSLMSRFATICITLGDAKRGKTTPEQTCYILAPQKSDAPSISLPPQDNPTCSLFVNAGAKFHLEICPETTRRLDRSVSRMVNMYMEGTVSLTSYGEAPIGLISQIEHIVQRRVDELQHLSQNLKRHPLERLIVKIGALFRSI